MTKQGYWNSLAARNTGFQDEDARVNISVASLRQIVFQAYERGAQSATAPRTDHREPALDPVFAKYFEGLFRQAPARSAF